MFESNPENRVEKLWMEYGEFFRDFDDLTLARWMAQTLSQLHGRVWRLSHPMMGAYRLASQMAHERQIWLKRMVQIPTGYYAAECCRAPFLPLATRDLGTAGFICQHCGGILVPPDEFPTDAAQILEAWSKEYAPIHAVAHWEEDQKSRCQNYQQEMEDCFQKASQSLANLGRDILPKMLEFYPALVWEDQDECLGVRPEDILLNQR